MAIVKMNKISILGMDSIKLELVDELMEMGVVELNSLDEKQADEEWKDFIERDGNENEIVNLESTLTKISNVIDNLEKYDTSKKPMFFTRKEVSSTDFISVLKEKSFIEEKVEHILSLNGSLNELSAQENKIETLILSLRPWIDYKIPLDLNETKTVSFFIGVMPIIFSIDKLKENVNIFTDRYLIDIIGRDNDQYYLSIICLKSEKEEVYEVLKQNGFNLLSFKDIEGTAVESIAKYNNELKVIAQKKLEIKEQITNYITHKNSILYLYDYTIMERDKARILRNLVKTKKTFYIEGWFPADSSKQLENVLLKHECYYQISEPQDDEEFPILLKNNSFSMPFEAVTELYSLPASSNIDPTAVMSPFYFLFFGMMLADVGYGAIMAIACFLVLKKFKLEGTIKKMITLFFWCGISTAFWGVMFGSWFGDAVPTISKLFFKSDFAIKPLWLNPMEQPMTVLIWSFVFGLVHLFAGLGMKGYMLIRDGQILDAVYDVGFWVLFIIGPILMLAGDMIMPGLAQIGTYVTIVGAVGLILTQGRSSSGIFSKLINGVLSLYGITGYLSDVLSYSRLLALGLASGVISSVLSILGSMGGDGIIGVILFTVVMIFGHTFNFAINALGSFVHAARLQYVEYFGKFYAGGGEAFNPLNKKTKYIRIMKEEI